MNFEQYYTAGYDPPFKLFGRRNEIWFVKKAEKEEAMNGDVAKEEVEGKPEVAQENGDVTKEESGQQVANGEGEVKQENGEVVHVTDWVERDVAYFVHKTFEKIYNLLSFLYIAIIILV